MARNKHLGERFDDFRDLINALKNKLNKFESKIQSKNVQLEQCLAANQRLASERDQLRDRLSVMDNTKAMAQDNQMLPDKLDDLQRAMRDMAADLVQTLHKTQPSNCNKVAGRVPLCDQIEKKRLFLNYSYNK